MDTSIGRPDSLAAFESGLKKLVAVPKNALVRKVKAQAQRRKKKAARSQGG